MTLIAATWNVAGTCTLFMDVSMPYREPDSSLQRGTSIGLPSGIRGPECGHDGLQFSDLADKQS